MRVPLDEPAVVGRHFRTQRPDRWLQDGSISSQKYGGEQAQWECRRMHGDVAVKKPDDVVLAYTLWGENALPKQTLHAVYVCELNPS